MVELNNWELRREQKRRLEEYEEHPATFIANHYATLMSDSYNGKRCKTGDCTICPDYLAHSKMLNDIGSKRFEMEIELEIVEENETEIYYAN